MINFRKSENLLLWFCYKKLYWLIEWSTKYKFYYSITFLLYKNKLIQRFLELLLNFTVYQFCP